MRGAMLYAPRDGGLAYRLLGSGTTSRHDLARPGADGREGRIPMTGIDVRTLLPPITPGLILRALLGALLFFCGLLLGVLLLFRFRRHSQDSTRAGRESS